MTTKPMPVAAAICDDRILDFRPRMDMYWEITRSTADTNGEMLETVNWIGPHTGGPPVHVHEAAEETYEVLDGTLEVLVDGNWRTLRTGDKTTVRRGIPHTLKNSSDQPVRIINTHRPAFNFEAMFRDMHALIQAGTIKRLPPKDPRSIIAAAMLFARYASEQRFVRPPQQVFTALAVVGRIARVKLAR